MQEFLKNLKNETHVFHLLSWDEKLQSNHGFLKIKNYLSFRVETKIGEIKNSTISKLDSVILYVYGGFSGRLLLTDTTPQGKSPYHDSIVEIFNTTSFLFQFLKNEMEDY
jgi:hypothetical protein